MQKRRILTLILVVTLMLTSLLAGCKSNEPATTNQPEQTNNATENKESKDNTIPKGMKKVNGILMDEEQYLRLVEFEPESLDTTRSSISSAWRAQTPLFEGLTRVEMTEDGVEKIVPGMAERWEHNEEGTEYTFYLRDAVWSDGKPVRAQDFEYAIKRLLDPKTASKYGWFFCGIIKNATEFNGGKCSADEVGIYAVDDKTLKVELAKPVPYFMQLTYFIVFSPLRQDIAEKYGDSYGQEAEHIVANGPFILKEWVHDNKLVYEKNPNYWDKEHVYIDKMEFVNLPDDSARMQALLRGEIDAAALFKREWKEKFQSMDGYQFIMKPLAWTEYIMFNHKDRYFKNDKIRKAFTIAYDRDELNDLVFGGGRIPPTSFVPDNIMLGDENYQNKIGNPKYLKKLVDENPDPKALLIEGLKELGEDPDPAKMEISYMTNGNGDIPRKMAEFFQQSFKKNLGVDIKLEIVASNVAYDKFDGGEFQIFETGWIGDYNDPSTFMDLWKSGKQGNYPQIGWVNEEFDKLVIEAGKELDPNKRAEMYKRAEEILIYEDCVCGPYLMGTVNTAIKDYVNNYHEFSFVKRNYVGVYTKGRK
ncbi:peptide ABC transporter substrate-binding protein [Paramaledivibacter caminithermalis]|jgi:oligopeptide transport system substrate-binding protein|uniref:Oligopeptide transport system substrate-binding protein n=1 Tax=Paramaledivibacter caminithermalis (strain DSM 15212 / CIP 107654 / DViRD3) TaxID=1121301 RepID=A0A1M6K792_PARC5|nr:peptide ABC transporter substrate-binding protein [Paramaledivibacter caminithermalis]SHJ54792.1 oligopeptide transport system substrate-binding protein [Paramaledivibacter caminithermalis DSM 15212]